ncbi:MAG: hypothetical protein HY320_01035 [Armatimonadetes bacterium]|nr:hypothetical protein [Armatimonadota bacterium]
MKTKLHALHMRLAELNHEMERTQIRAHHLESRLEDARLAALFGEESGETQVLQPQLDEVRHRLEGQQALIASIKNSQWRTRIHYLLLRQRERREQQNGDDPA